MEVCEKVIFGRVYVYRRDGEVVVECDIFSSNGCEESGCGGGVERGGSWWFLSRSVVWDVFGVFVVEVVCY